MVFSRFLLCGLDDSTLFPYDSVEISLAWPMMAYE